MRPVFTIPAWLAAILALAAVVVICAPALIVVGWLGLTGSPAGLVIVALWLVGVGVGARAVRR